MRIAVVDDSRKARHDIAGLIIEYLVERTGSAADFVYDEYDSGEDFLAHYQKENYQLILLDIYMNGLTGMEAARRIRELDDNTPLAFITSSPEHALEGYEVYAAGYIIKPVRDNRDQFVKLLERVLPLSPVDVNLTVKSGGRKISIPLDRLYYLDTGGTRFGIFHTAAGVVKSDFSLEESRALLTAANFLECYRGIIINMDLVREMTEEEFIMESGETLPISRRKRKAVAEAYMNYILTK